jgi:hypothetical protein
MKTEKEFFALCLEYLRRSPIYQEFLKTPTSNDDKFNGVKHLHNLIQNRSITLSPYPAARLINSVEYAERLKSDMAQALSMFREINKRDPSPEELIAASCELGAVMGKNTLYIKVQMKSVRTLTETREDIGDCVKKVLRKIGKESRKDFLKEISYPYITKKALLENLKRYIGVYDMKLAGEPWEKIAVFMGKKQSARKGCFEHPKEPDKDFDDLDLTREIRRDFTNAKKIISNVEGGVFPGDF